MRHTKGHTANRRSHHGLKAPRLSSCGNCEAKHLRHRVCPDCGQYKGRQVVDVSVKETEVNKG
ncbi:50S ribosomal protein L32 [Patescibacteria group bacterium]